MNSCIYKMLRLLQLKLYLSIFYLLTYEVLNKYFYYYKFFYILRN